MKHILLICVLALLPSFISSQTIDVVRGDCTPDPIDDDVAGARGGQQLRRLPSIRTNWDSTRVYRQAVILVSFSDTDFSLDNPQEFYDSMFNVKGFNKRNGPGCVADYLRDQSGGLFNVKFDIYGPIKVSQKAQPYASPNANTRNYGRDSFTEATKIVIDSLHVDFAPYDWSNNGWVNQVIYIYAGLTGNQSSEICYGHIWPNTSSFSTINANGKQISNYTCSAEMWANRSSCGIGTVLHEFSHSLGLPDFYPTVSNAGYSVLDEWELMDGGNFTNYGWCPPNYTPMEKILLGWLTPVDLTESQTVSNLKPVDEGGVVYRIKHSDNEWLLLENRQQKGWDLGTPGKGLMIYHVYYEKSVWGGNSVNNDKTKRRYNLISADNMDYDKWYKYVMSWSKPKQYVNAEHMNSYLLSTSPYPWSTDSTSFVNDMLTGNSVPSTLMNYPNSEGNNLLSVNITEIKQHDDGTVSFAVKPMAKCAEPTITYQNGQLHFHSDTEGATFVSRVTSDDMKLSQVADISLTKQYTVTVYATADGYLNSDTVTATIKWGDGTIEAENITVTSTIDKKGDVNQDGTVDVADISSVITIMANDTTE